MSMGRAALDPDFAELRVDVPRRLLAAIDAIAMANPSRSRTSIVIETLESYVALRAEEARYLLNALRTSAPVVEAERDE